MGQSVNDFNELWESVYPASIEETVLLVAYHFCEGKEYDTISKQQITQFLINDSDQADQYLRMNPNIQISMSLRRCQENGWLDTEREQQEEYAIAQFGAKIQITQEGRSFIESNLSEVAENKGGEGFVEPHEELADSIELYSQGQYEAAVREGWTVIESEIRSLSGFDENQYGKDMMARAFNEDSGPLTKRNNRGEKEGVKLLFMGAIQALRNPAMHQSSSGLTKREAHDILCLINLLLSTAKEGAQ
jgi:uncharacterized protein (TIGR02391 family)